MELIEIAILTGLVVIVILLMLIGVLAYKLRRIKKQWVKEVKKPIEAKAEEPEKQIKSKKRSMFTKRIRKPREAKQYDIWK